MGARDTVAMKRILDDSSAFVSQAFFYRGKSLFASHYVGLFGRMQQEHRLFTLAYEPTHVEASAHESLAAETGTFSQRWEEAPGVYEELHGPYFAVWKTVNGQWLLLAQAWTPLNCGRSAPDCDY
jgi:hypothetical protein